MEDKILQFISALRASGVRVSLAESEDAFRAVQELGVREREAFRISLRATLIKEAADFEIFDELFSIFFEAGGQQFQNPSEDLTPEEAQLLAQALRQFSEQMRKMLERLLRGEQLTRQELEELGNRVGLPRANDMRYREWLARRMQQALQFDEVREAVRELLELLAQLGMQSDRLQELAEIMGENQNAVLDQLRQHAGERIAKNMADRPPSDNVDRLMNRPFNALSEQDIQVLRKEVRRLATALRTRIALRQKRAKSGQLDAKATIRANLKHGSVPFDIRHKDRRLKPKLVVVCDVSTSMRHVSELMLTLLFTLQDLISKTHAFAFIDHLEYITPDFRGQDISGAVIQVLERLPSGYYNTDLGHSLQNFRDRHMGALDQRTSFILVGDGRNNYNSPRLDILREIGRRSHRTIWLNPEPAVLWGTGDSDMLEYAPLCDVILQVGNLKELTSAVDRLLAV